ncbi:MAG TPA: peptide chain release factor N(5)-glutamine methyltransferase [Acetivibrio sp.]|jgi:release factor glutamine methyltransferase|nr:peptide chain release factor N(5)-glutamine methyltransferase [Clostridium sp.]HOQ37838.1 peptide chain release factor N(5)-glutamine methyltransferase [Acetivibrio sp.]HPT91996.1 peptide chain release factor N(5)-glutamine methyltransferase [Acetivibrio sp.]HQA58923.1 peptide chain release factor N(5)-glutamine methyltransferase [Acetivibrio sp.]
MVLKDALLKGIQQLKTANVDAPVFEAGVILCHILKVSRSFLYSHDDYIMTDEKYKCFDAFIRERAEGKPLQYITGHQEFMSMDFIVTPDVLIPRQDTEVLVETVLNYVEGSDNKETVILDIGTGSGCIAISLATYIKNSKVIACDISQKALDVAKTNAQRCGVENQVDFICGDIFQGLDKVLCQSTFIKDLDQRSFELFDAIVSNPPYIPSWEIETLHRQVKDFEPGLALNGGEDGLDFYRKITEEAVRFLKPHSLLAFEVGYNQAGDVARLMENGYRDIKAAKDLSGIDRVVIGFRK